MYGNIVPMTAAYAGEMAFWRYEGECSFYNRNGRTDYPEGEAFACLDREGKLILGRMPEFPRWKQMSMREIIWISAWACARNFAGKGWGRNLYAWEWNSAGSSFPPGAFGCR